eukprot:11209980-Lingulodinium_polyedra.AAC.1
MVNVHTSLGHCGFAGGHRVRACVSPGRNMRRRCRVAGRQSLPAVLARNGSRQWFHKLQGRSRLMEACLLRLRRLGPAQPLAFSCYKLWSRL